MGAWIRFWTPFPAYLVINLALGYSLRTSWVLQRLSWRIERGCP